MVLCCRCNKTGRCRNCACVKADIQCQNCLPSRLGNCCNPTTSQPQLEDSVRQPSLSESSQPEDDPTVDVSSSVELEPPAPSLPMFESVQCPTFMWGEKDAEPVISDISSAYSEVMGWKKHLFPIPMGKAGSSFISELAGLYRAYAEMSSLECIALKAAAIIPTLLLKTTRQVETQGTH